MLKRLAMYNVEYVLASSDEYAFALDRVAADEVYLEKQIGRFRLYKIVLPAARIEVSTYKPFAFIEAGGLSFRAFAEQWYKNSASFVRPVILADKEELHTSAALRQHLGGIIVSLGESELPPPQYQAWLSLGLPIIFITDQNLEPQAGQSPRVTFLPHFVEWQGWQQIGAVMESVETEPPHWAPSSSQRNPS